MSFKLSHLAAVFAVVAATTSPNAFAQTYQPQYYYPQTSSQSDTHLASNPKSSRDLGYTSFNDVLRTGDIHVDHYTYNQLHISWSAQDAFIDTYKKLKSSVTASLRKNKTVQALLKKDLWERSDRQEWQHHLCQTITNQVDEIPGLDAYRIISTDPKVQFQKATRRSTWLNSLAHDIKNGTQDYEFDCEMQSAMKGCLAQEIENDFLKSFLPESQKEPRTYRYVIGQFYPTPIADAKHAFVLLPTGDIFECTQDPSEGNIPACANSVESTYSADDFIQGKPNVVSVGQGLRVYARSLDTKSAKSALKKSQDAGLIKLVNHLD